MYEGLERLRRIRKAENFPNVSLGEGHLRSTNLEVTAEVLETTANVVVGVLGVARYTLILQDPPHIELPSPAQVEVHPETPVEPVNVLLQ